MSDHVRYAVESSPRIVPEDSRPTSPLVSLIVPVWNDDQLIVDLVNSLPITPGLVEWVVAAVRPGKRLCEMHRQGNVRLICCHTPSRGRQMNSGAAAAHGSLLCFHHADSDLRPEHLNALERTAKNDAILGGAFHRRFDDRRGYVVWWEGLVRRLNSFAGPLFGDQSIFVRASVFERLGGFADIPLMEDIEFSRRLRRLGRIVLLDPPIWTSPRRFRRLGNWSTTLLNVIFISLFYLGIDPNTLHKWYYRNLRGSSGHGFTVDAPSREVRSE